MNAELIAALKDAEGYIIYVAPNCVASCESIKAIRAAADALEAAEHRIEDLEGALAACRARKDGRMPKEGEWIIDGMNEYQLSYGCVGYEPIYRCSKCGITTESYLRTERPIMPEDADFPNYCPNCGARMQTVTDCHTFEEGER